MIAAVAATLGACASRPMMMKVDNAALPEAVRVPAGQRQMMATVATGEITCECREKKDMAGQHDWAFVGPVATLYGADRRVTGKQVAVAAASPGNIPLQLVKAEPAMGTGAMTGVGYIQRLNTKGGVAPAMACDAMGKGARQVVAYEADYVFYGM